MFPFPLKHFSILFPFPLKASRMNQLTRFSGIRNVIAQFVARIKGYKVEGQTGVTGTYPTQCHHDGEVLSL